MIMLTRNVICNACMQRSHFVQALVQSHITKFLIDPAKYCVLYNCMNLNVI